jgi:alpha-maltose-1-phosphate synthase
MPAPYAATTAFGNYSDSNRASGRQLQVVLSTLGKFHTFDLARQLYRRNALKAIFTGYPSFKLSNEQLPSSLIRTFPYLHAPYMRVGPTFEPLKRIWERQDRLWLDRYVRANLPDCDVFCGLSGSGLRTGELAKSRGARYVCDRGSSHIRYQDQILRTEYDRQKIRYTGIDRWIIQQEEAEYALAHIITVPSQFAFDSFIACGVPSHKLRLIPYGVDLSRFYRIDEPSRGEFNILFVGALSVRKGIPYLLEAFEQLRHPRKRLTLIGGHAPELLPLISGLHDRSDVSILGTVPQESLKQHMSRSHVMVLPSIEEGLALVQAQAMACGCPLVCSTNTGASELFSDGVEGFIVPPRDSESIAGRLQLLADNPDLRDRMGSAALARVKSIQGWNEYGERMYATFCETRNQ